MHLNKMRKHLETIPSVWNITIRIKSTRAVFFPHMLSQIFTAQSQTMRCLGNGSFACKIGAVSLMPL